MNYSAKTVTSENPSAGQRGRGHHATCRVRRRQRQRSMWTMAVVVVEEDGEDSLEVPLVEDQQVVETLGADCPDEAFSDGIGLRGTNGCAENLDGLAPKHLVEPVREGPVAIANQKPEGLCAVSDRPGQLACALRAPQRGGMRRAAGEVDAATAQFNDEEHVQPLQADGLDREEICCEQTSPVHAHEVAPRHAFPRAHGPEAGAAQPRSEPSSRTG